ncbi:histone-lysine N-methyltransferase SUV39H2 [Aplysia californica]|uniref:Histone-lysine N-methyltransferase n=1 Tax=Aplysia californica TaxID=6500 RepID=A0ABM0K1B3_APLCA|nr:histone-lysine N-methyltransferase SUV39H2 [Aplysia californica]
MEVPCLIGLLDLQQLCTENGLKLSQETLQYVVYEMLKKLGPSQSQKLITKLVEDGVIEWDDDFEVEMILDHWFDKEENEMFYLIKWLGWSHEYNSWEPKKNLSCSALLEEFHIHNGLKPNRKRKLYQPFAKVEDPQARKSRLIEELFFKLTRANIMDKISLIDLVNHHSPVKKRAESTCLVTSGHRKKYVRRMADIGSKKGKTFKAKKAEVGKALKDWETYINSVAQELDPAPLYVENVVDLEGPPHNFIYINKRKHGEGVDIPQDPLIGCDCDDCHDCRKTCCPVNSGSQLAYRVSKRLKVPRGVPIFECNMRCKCGPDCVNRVAQKGRTFKVCIFRTPNGRGWGVKTLQKIKKGSFVMEYVGEVISNEEAERRGKEYDACGLTYLFDLDFHDAEGPYSVDAGVYGNAAHFINHSCDPNLEVHVVWINTLDPRFPHICLFAKRDIDRNEELSFDYLSGQIRNDTSFEERNETMMEVDGTMPDGSSAGAENMVKGIAEVAAAASPVGEKVFKEPLFLPGMDISLHLKDKPATQGDSQDKMFPKINDLPTPPASDTESVSGSTAGPMQTPRFQMLCLCGAKNCRNFLFF